MSATNLSENKLHYPVLLKEVLSIVTPQIGGTFIDCTFGQGGYSEKILQFPKAKVIAFDRDQKSKVIAEKFKKKFKDRFEFYNKRFSEIDLVGTSHQIKGIIFDLGFSYDQIRDSTKGLSFNYKGRLNMKMGQNNISARDIIKYLTANELEKIFKYFGEEKYSKKISKKIVKDRKFKEIYTEDLVDIINAVKKNYEKKNKSTKVFQALRILVNNEISELIIGLSKACNIISKNGVIAVVAFHSIEDRICKFFFNEISSLRKVSRYLPINNNSDVSFKSIKKKPIIPTKKEIDENPPSRSAKLRAVQRTGINKIDTNFIFEKFKYLLELEKMSLKL
tara:strand:- start:19925 stop:20929 length:1005 start_codon:yes stop_codon:yes gene_type:complete